MEKTTGKLNELLDIINVVPNLSNDKMIQDNVSIVQKGLDEIRKTPGVGISIKRAFAERAVRKALIEIDAAIRKQKQDDNKHDNKHVDKINDDTLISYLKEMYPNHGKEPLSDQLDLRKINDLLAPTTTIKNHNDFNDKIQDIKTALKGGNNIALLYCAYKGYIARFNAYLVNNRVTQMTPDLLRGFMDEWKAIENRPLNREKEPNMGPLAEIIYDFYSYRFTNSHFAGVLTTQNARTIFTSGHPLYELNIRPDEGYEAEYSWG